MRHAVESATNVVLGYLINLALVYLLLHGMGYKIRMHENAGIGAVLAAVAFIRGYGVRRFFHKKWL
jgi:uncharacterized membrane protein|tara:strand:+ start:7975 stop:8172 length:198 start_codon:yes stop_codon:yes gene_type:complete